MANQGAKKRLDENSRRCRALRIAVLVGVLIQVAGFIASPTRRASTMSWVGALASAAISALAFWGIASFAAPIYENGELVDGGPDLSKATIAQYLHDILYISVFVNVSRSQTRSS
jgi:hypothetical protein